MPHITHLTTEEVKKRFDSDSAAKNYSKHADTWSDRFEKAHIGRLLKNYGKGSLVLDLPCGTGRMIPFLRSHGFRVVAADASPFMVGTAKEFVSNQGCPVKDTELVIADALNTNFVDDTFDIILCNRLFHHLTMTEDRRKVLKELKRITNKTIILSFFCSSTWHGLMFNVKNFISGRKPRDRIPITLSTILSDIEHAGLRIKVFSPVIPFISKQCYLVLEKQSNE